MQPNVEACLNFVGKKSSPKHIDFELVEDLSGDVVSPQTFDTTRNYSPLAAPTYLCKLRMRCPFSPVFEFVRYDVCHAALCDRN